MSLRSHFEESIPERRRKQLSNADNTGGSTQNDTVVDAACRRAKAYIRIYAGLDYDADPSYDDDDRIWTVAVDGVVKILQRQNGALEKNDSWRDWVAQVKDLASVTTRNRVKPQTNSKLTPTPEVRNGETVRPDFDRSKFNKAVPDNNDNTQDRLTRLE